MQKLGRNYFLQVGLADGTLLPIQLPFTIEFDISRNILPSANVCSIRIYNLSANHRNLVRLDPMDIIGTYRPVILQAGYNQDLSTIFSGNMTQAWSVREGTNFVTTLECFDGGFAFANAVTGVSFPGNTSYQTIISTLASSATNLTKGAIGSFPGTINKGKTYSGNPLELLANLTGNAVFVDSLKVNCLGDNECLANPGIPVIDASTGLLGTPVRENLILTFDMIFEPKIVVSQQVQLLSTAGGASSVATQGQIKTGSNPTSSNFNGFYKVTSVKHRGMISGAICGDAITTLKMFWGTQTLVPVFA